MRGGHRLLLSIPAGAGGIRQLQAAQASLTVLTDPGGFFALKCLQQQEALSNQRRKGFGEARAGGIIFGSG